MTETKIPEGAKVHVTFFDGTSLSDCWFVRGPQGPGDCYVVEMGNGKVAYIQHFTIMRQEAS